MTFPLRNVWAQYLIVCVAAAVLIGYEFNVIPSGLTFDEVEFARLAVMLGEMPYTPYTEFATGHATLYFYIMRVSFLIFGLSEFGLRLPSAIFGILTAGMMFLVMNEAWGKASIPIRIPFANRKTTVSYALIAGLLFVSLRWFFGFARFSFEATFLLFLELVSLYAILRFMHSPRKWAWLIVSAVAAGLAFNSYQPGRFFAIIPIAVLFLKMGKHIWKPLFVWGIVYAIFIAPLTIHLIQHPDVRVKQQLYFQDPMLHNLDKMMFFSDNVWRNTKLFFIEGDPNGRHNYPFRAALNPIVAALGVVGLLAVSARSLKNFYPAVFLLYFAIAMGPTLLTYPHENPNMLRTVTVIPSLVYFSAMGIQTIISLGSTFAPKKAVPWLGTLMVLLVLMSAAIEVRTYFIFQREIFHDSFEVKDRFGGVYFFMKQNDIDINTYKIPSDQIDKFYSVPGPHQTYTRE